MKVEQLDNQTKFQPIELKITIESAEELAGLYRKIADGDTSFDGAVVSGSTNRLFDKLYDIARERGYVK